MIWNPDYMRNDYDYYLHEARSMSTENIKMKIEQMKNLSDDPEENIATGEMQLMFSAYQQVLEERDKILVEDKEKVPT